MLKNRCEDLHMDNAFLPRVCAIKGEGEGLKCEDGEEFFFYFFLKEEKVEWALTEEERKKA